MNVVSATPIPFYEFSSDKASEAPKWSPMDLTPDENLAIHGFTLATWNVWFGKLEQDIRFASVVKTLLSLSADIVCIQEATPGFIEKVFANSDIRRDWVLSDYRDEHHKTEIQGHEEIWYGNMILVQKKWAGNIRGWVKQFPTSKKRRYIVILEIYQGNTGAVI
jgi:endonuclease/exonuclease/phosphatase family metal-dependent hydrolase